MTTPDLATRLLDACEKLGVGTGDWRRQRNEPKTWYRVESHFNESGDFITEGYGPEQATRTEIESLAFRLIVESITKGVHYKQELDGTFCAWKGRTDESAPFDLTDPDFIEAAILAAEKMGGEG